MERAGIAFLLILVFYLTGCLKIEDERSMVLTGKVSGVNYRDCFAYGEILLTIENGVVQHGFCWSENKAPELGNAEKTELGPRLNKGIFTGHIEGLTPDVKYHLRAYIRTQNSTYYGDEMEFTTAKPVVPSLTTNLISNITNNGADAGGEISDDGGFSITDRGICWDVVENPTTDKASTHDGNGDGNYHSSMTNLECKTEYYVRAYASNALGTGYGNQLVFETASCLSGLPSVTTTDVSSISDSSAVSGGVISSSGGTSIITRGVCWSTSNNPSISDNFTSDDDGLGSYSSSLDELFCGTTYYVRAYATNSSGISYGQEVEFSTDPCAVKAPTIITTQVTNITPTSAEVGGDVTDMGGSSITGRGICWSTSSNPEVSDGNKSISSGSGEFSGAIGPLSCNTIYFVRAYAINSAGTSYGQQISFKTSSCSTSKPTVSTGFVQDISYRTALCGGTITDGGGAAITSKGICWSTSQNPITSDNKTVNGEGEGSFIGLLDELVCGTTYYVRAYATNSAGTSYGSQQVFSTTMCQVPAIVTREVENIGDHEAIAGGNLVEDGGSDIVTKGVCWSSSPGPTISDEKTIEGTTLGEFQSTMEGLDMNTIYYIRAYATNGSGTAYGQELTFKTNWDNATMLQDYDGNQYQTVQIGEQIWMAENLKVTHYPDGSPITLSDENNSFSQVEYCWYNNDPANGNTYGALYELSAALKACPTGWHLPNNAEWDILSGYLGGSDVAGGKMKTTGTTIWYGPNFGATNESGFSALPGGSYESGNFRDMRSKARFWSSTTGMFGSDYGRTLTNASQSFSPGGTNYPAGLSVRCVKDEY